MDVDDTVLNISVKTETESLKAPNEQEVKPKNSGDFANEKMFLEKDQSEKEKDNVRL